MPDKLPNISVLIPWKDRSELEYTLERNQSEFEAVGAEVLVINCGGDIEQLLSMQRRLRIPFLRLIETAQLSFNKSLGFNVGSSFARADRLMMLDSDVVFEPNLIVGMRERLCAGVCVAVEWMQESSQNLKQTFTPPSPPKTEMIRTNIMEFRFADGTARNVVTHRYSLSKQRRSGLSLLMMDKSDFVAVEGFHSAIGSWGWEDNDLHLRLQWRRGLTVVEYGTVHHLSHDDSQRALQGRSQMESLNANLLSAVSRYEIGDLLGTYTADVAQWAKVAHEISL